MTTRQNEAAWIVQDRAPLVVQEAPTVPPGPYEILVEVRAVAINPVDYSIAQLGQKIFPWLSYPRQAGFDAAGSVIEVGDEVSRFRIGQRVVGHASHFNDKDAHKKPGYGAFQRFALLTEHMASVIPDSLSFEDASVLPLALSTAASGLFEANQLALALPSPIPSPNGLSLLVWGGATSVGLCAIQLAVCAGYDIVTTCSPHNDALVRKLGARASFDYRQADIVEKILKSLEGLTLAGALAISGIPHTADIIEKCALVVDRAQMEPGRRRFVASAIPLGKETEAKLRDGRVEARFIWGSSLAQSTVGAAIYADFLGPALEAGTFVAAPPPLIVGKGLEKIQEGFSAAKKGLSAQKVVVSL